MPWENILKALETGGMKAQGAPLSISGSPGPRDARCRFHSKLWQRPIGDAQRSGPKFY
jgi:hypothetical protein